MGMPVTGPPSLGPNATRGSPSPRAGNSAAARRRRRRRRRRRWRQAMLWLLTVVTTGVLVLIAGFVKEISKVPTVARPAALTATAHPARHGTASASPAAATQVREVADRSSGLSYWLLSSPWRGGCPGTLATP